MSNYKTFRDALPLTGEYSVHIMAENINQITTLEKSLNEMWIKV